MNTEDDEFERIEREQAMRSVPDPIHHTDPGETLEYITGWNDCRAAMLAQPEHHDPIGVAQDRLIAEQAAQKRPQNCGTGYCSCIKCVMEPAQQEPLAWGKPTDEMVQAATDEYDEWANENKGATECIRAMLAKALKASPQAQPAREPLTDDQIHEMANDFEEGYVFLYRSFARAIEAAHDIKEKS